MTASVATSSTSARDEAVGEGSEQPSQRRKSRRAWRLLAFAGGATVGATALIGFAHTPAGRPLLRYLPGVGSCPVDYANLTAAQVEPGRVAALRAHRGTQRAAVRPALGFMLETTTATDVAAWIRQHGISCTWEMGRGAARCAHAPEHALSLAAAGAAAEGATGALGRRVYDELYFRFDPAERLVGVDAEMRLSPNDVDEGFAVAQAHAARLEAAALLPTEVRGDRKAFAGRLGAYDLTYGYANYRATVTAVNVTGKRILVRFQAQAIPEA